MKRNNIYLLITLLSILLSCNSDEKVNGNGFVRIGIITNTSVITKAEGDVEIKNIRLVISNVTENSSDKDWSKEYNFAPDAPSEDIELAPGNYKLVAIASNGSEVADGFTPAYMGEAMVEVTAGNTSTAWIECKLTTVKVLVEYASSVVGTYQTEYKTVVGGVAFSGEEKRAGYIAPGNLSVDFMFKDNAGSWQTISLDKIAEAKAQEYYKIKISMKSTEGEGDGSSEGAANITIQIGKENPKDIEIGIVLPKVVVTTLEAENVEYTTATLKGSYLSPSGATPKNPEFKYRIKDADSWSSVAATVVGETNEYTALVNLESGTEYEYSFMGKGEALTLATKDIYTTSEEKAVGTDMAYVYGVLNIESGDKQTFEYQLASLSESSPWSSVDATTSGDGKYEATLSNLEKGKEYRYRFSKSKTVQTLTTCTAITVKSVTAGADYAKVKWNVECVQPLTESDKVIVDYKFKKLSDGNWSDSQRIMISFVEGGDEDLKIEGLEQNGTYCIDEETKSFTTLKNASFDEWGTGKVPGALWGTVDAWFPGTSGEAKNLNTFWDTGNTGAAKMSKSPTSQEKTDVYVKGGSSAKLESQFVGIPSLGKFAAGNIYVGKYVDTYSSKPLGAKIRFGREFSSRPTQLKGKYKYNRGKSVDYGDYNKEELNASGGDKCAIYIALSDNEGLESGGIKTAYEIDNRASEDQPDKFIYKSTVDFSENNRNIVGYGSITDEESKSTEDWQEFSINLEYRKPQSIPKFLIIVASASKYGDYFTGSSKSLMYIDDFELVYDYTKVPYTN